MPSLTSQLIISLIDRVSGPAKGVGAVLKDVAKTAGQLGKTSGSGANFGKNFNAEIAKMKLSARDLEQIRDSFRKFEETLRSGGKKLKAADYFGAINDWKSKTISGLRQMQIATEDAERARAKLYRGWRGGARLAAGALGVGGAAYTANRAGRAALTATAGNEREGARDYLAGLSAADTARLKARSLGLSRQYPSVDTQVMHQSLRETAMSMRSVDKASELGDTLAQGLVVLQSLKGKDEALKESAKFFSALDTLGKNLDPAEVKDLYNGYLKALGVEGVDLNLADLKQIAQKSKSAGPGLSNRFLMSTAPGLQGDMGAQRLGTALGSEVAQIIGDRATKAAKAQQEEFGLRDANGWKDQTKIMTDPDKFAWENLIPALKNKGVDADDIPAVTKAMNQIFSNQMVADLFTKLITQREQYQAKSKQYEAAPGLSAAEGLRGKDPYVAFEGLMAQLRNAASQLAEGPLQRAVPLLNDFTDSIARLTETLAKNPAASAAVGATVAGGTVVGGVGALYAAKKGYQWFTGAGKATGAAALTGGAAAEGAAASSWLSRLGVIGRLRGLGPLGLMTMGDGRPDNSVDDLTGLQSAYRAAREAKKRNGGAPSIWENGTNPINHLDASGDAASAGQKTGEAYKASINSALQGVDKQIEDAVQRWIGKLTFSAHPTITPNISAPAGQKSGALESTSAKQHAMFADYGFNTA